MHLFMEELPSVLYALELAPHSSPSVLNLSYRFMEKASTQSLFILETVTRRLSVAGGAP